jgi:hypothetical protein
LLYTAFNMEEVTMERNREPGMNRRDFLGVTVASGTALFLAGCNQSEEGLRLLPEKMLGGIQEDGVNTPIENATWYIAENIGDGLSYSIPKGSLAQAQYITADMLLDGNHMIVFMIDLHEADDGRTFRFRFSGLNQCSLRVRLPLTLVDQNRWGIDREAAFLKPRCSGDRVDLEKIDKMTLTVFRKSPQPARWCMTAPFVSEQEVPTITEPVLPKGPLLDELGQSTLHEWAAKSRSVEEVTSRIKTQLADSESQKWPENFSEWGGWKVRRIEKGSGYFRTHHDGQRWWLLDPEGYGFWSAGLDCVRVDTYGRYDGLESALTWLPEAESEFKGIFRTGPVYQREEKFINYLAANFIRTFGSEGWRENWAQIAMSELKRLRFNTVGNWSEWEYAKRAQFPYVRPMSFQPERCIHVYRDFPDVFDPAFQQDAVDYASVLADTTDDPALIGYFLMNEPKWGFSSELPAAGMLFVTPECKTREELAHHLREKHEGDQALSSAWGIQTSFDQIASGPWNTILSEAALKDLEEFSVIMVEHYFKTLSEACRAVDPNHLNLGMRWAGLPPKWAVRGMRFFDVYSINCYRDRVPREVTDGINELLNMATIIGEWHFGALDVGLPSSGIGHLWNQEDRAKAYRVYLEDAAANPNCVGTHWFTLYDESALGRFDGENYNIGFLDICNRAYEELGAAAIASHERLYDVVAGTVEPYSEVPEYLPKLY